MNKILLLFLLFFAEAVDAQKPFSITGYGEAYKEGDSIFLSYKQGEHAINEATVVENGAFHFKGMITIMNRGYLSRKANPLYAEFIADAFDVYLEKGNITLHSADSLKNSIISGTPLNNDYAQLVSMLKPVIANFRSLKDPDKLTAEELKDSVLVKDVNAKMYGAIDAGIPVRFAFINNFPNSYVSLYTLGKLARTSKLLAQVEVSYAKLSAELKAMPEGKEIARRIALGKIINVGMPSKDFTQPDAAGKPVRLSDYKGKYVLVDFWASWCLPCREENSNVVAAYYKYNSKGFTVLSVSIDVLKDKASWINAIKEDKLPWANVSDLRKENEAAKLYGITTIPANVLIGPDGKVIAKDLKREGLQNKLAEIFQKK